MPTRSKIQHSPVLCLCTNLKLLGNFITIELGFKQRFMTIRCRVVKNKKGEKESQPRRQQKRAGRQMKALAATGQREKH